VVGGDLTSDEYATGEDRGGENSDDDAHSR
jgi:hypothetical protein